MDLDEIVACPCCHGELRPGAEREYVCPACDRRFPPADGFIDLTPGHLPVAQGFDEIEALPDLEAQVTAAQVYYHDRIGSGYDEHWSTSGIFAPSSLRRVRNMVEYMAEIGGSELAVDIGAGTGHVLGFLHRRFTRAVGIDLSLQMLRVSANRGLTVLRGNGEALPFRSNSINALTAFSVLHHLVRPEAIFPELLRVLKPGGMLYTDWDQNRFFPKPLFGVWMMTYRPLRTLVGGLRRRLQRDELHRAFELAEYHPFRDFLDGEALRDQLLAAGFETAKVFYHANRGTPFDKEPPPFDLASLKQNLRWRHVLPVFMLVARKAATRDTHAGTDGNQTQH
ncbi:MAG: methyltransferase domain-containing protein [Planctomycetota bacterium]|jgi:ubiquinone/menaquinone biosynthesis C-methylase UbiE